MNKSKNLLCNFIQPPGDKARPVLPRENVQLVKHVVTGIIAGGDELEDLVEPVLVLPQDVHAGPAVQPLTIF